MGKYMQNEPLDAAVSAIVEDELSKYRNRLMSNISHHFSNPYCAKTDSGKVIYENEVMDLIERTK